MQRRPLAAKGCTHLHIAISELAEIALGGRWDCRNWGEKARKNKDGNVGIGTTSPNFKLDVTAKINATGIITDEASGAITTCNVGEIRGNATANKICLCTTANNWKCATVS